MQELRTAVAGLRSDLESFGEGVSARVQEVKASLESFVSGAEAAIASIRPEVESAATELSGRVDAADAELAELEP
jgi:hypothetical protein